MGLLNHDNARTIIQIISSLDEVGYDVEWQVTNSKYHVPQNRERIFIVGHLRESGSRKIFPITDINGQDIGKSTDKERVVSHSIDANYFKGPDKHAQRTIIQTGVYAVENPLFPNKVKNGSRIKTHDEPSFTLQSNPAFVQGVIVNKRLRKLTPTECERLQGFPDSWTEGQSDTQRYKQLGNAVTVPMVQIIAERFKIE